MSIQSIQNSFNHSVKCLISAKHKVRNFGNGDINPICSCPEVTYDTVKDRVIYTSDFTRQKEINAHIGSMLKNYRMNHE